MDILKVIKCGIDGYERSYNGYLMDTKIDSDTMMVGPVMPPGTFEVSNGDSPQKKHPSFEDLSLPSGKLSHNY